jgi:hypothetical protein
MNNKKGRYFLIGTKQTDAEQSLSGGQSPELTKDKAIEMINDELPSEIKDKLLKIFSQIDPKQAKGIAQLGEDAYIKTMIELTSRPIYGDDGKVGTELRGSGKGTSDEDDELTDDEYYKFRKDQAENIGYIEDTDLYRVVNKIIRKDHKDFNWYIGNRNKKSYNASREEDKEFYDIVDSIIESLEEKIKPSKKREVVKAEQVKYKLETDEQKDLYNNLVDLVMDQVKDTELNVKYATKYLDLNPAVFNEVTLKLATYPKLLDPFDGGDQRIKIWEEQKKKDPTIVIDNASYYNEIMFRNAIIKKGYKDVESENQLELLTDSKYGVCDIIGSNIIGDIKGGYREGDRPGYRCIDVKKMEKILEKADKSLLHVDVVIGWPPSNMSKEDTNELIKSKKNQEYFDIMLLKKKEDMSELNAFLKTDMTKLDLNYDMKRREYTIPYHVKAGKYKIRIGYNSMLKKYVMHCVNPTKLKN